MIRRAFRLHPWLTSAFALTALAATLFLGSALYDVIYWSTHQREPVRGWMTIGYVAKSWGLDGREIDALAGLPTPEQRPDGKPVTIRRLAEERGVPPAEIIAAVEKAVAELTAAREAAKP